MRPHKTTLVEKLDRHPPIDWSQFEKAGATTRNLLVELLNDKATLRYLVDSVEHSPKLLAQCESHELLDRMEIYDAQERGFQIRFNFSTNISSIRPHDHRYSFSTHIARGSYKHIWYDLGQNLNSTSESANLKNFMDKHHPDTHTKCDFDLIKQQYVSTESTNSQYTIHHSCVHATVTTPGTLSLIIKGPSEKNRSLIIDEKERKLWWRFGRADESDIRISQKRMAFEHYRRLRNCLVRWGITDDA